MRDEPDTLDDSVLDNVAGGALLLPAVQQV